jgi:hypothetical protein
MRAFFLTAIFCIFSVTASADVLYEGWHKVLSAGQHVGYFVVRYDLDKKTNKFAYTSYLKTNSVGNDVTEAIKAESLQVTKPTQWLVPQKYQYTSTQGKNITLIDANFNIEDAAAPKTEKPGKKKGKKNAKKEPEAPAVPAKPQLRMMATITKDGNATKYDQIVPDNTFLSSYLTYIILQSKDGLKVGNNYKYAAIAEEDGKLYDGVAFVKEMTKEGGQDGYKIVNEFKGIRFISVVNTKGDPISTKSPLLSIATEAASTTEEAVGKLKLDDKNIRTLFGDLPSAGVKK